jgi:parallel beta-helix repeat protein
LNLTDGLTIEAWVNYASTEGGHTTIAKWNDNTEDWSYIFEYRTESDTLSIELSESFHNDLAALQGSTALPLGTWVHVATTYDATEGIVRLYLNGVEDASLEVGAGRLIDASLTDLLIGAIGQIDQLFAGAIDEVSIYNRALSAADIAAIFDAGSAGKCRGAVFLVTTTQESGPGSLRQAILDANATHTETVSTIAFHIPLTDPGFDGHVFTLQPTTPLPAVRRPTFIDGMSQTAFSGDSNPLGPEVVLNGSLADRGNGLVLRGDRSAVIELVINGFVHGAGISLQTNARGDHPPSRHRLRNNYIGTDQTGTTAVPNAKGVVIQGGESPTAQAQDNQLTGNLITGNLGVGISLCEAADTRLTGNRIGTDRTGTAPLGNGSHGLLLHCAGAPRTLIEQNTIAFNAGDGIRIAPDYRAAVALTPEGHQSTTIRRNAIFANEGLGINLLPPPVGTEDGSTANDVCDADLGANRLQNFPDLLLVTSDGQSTHISGTLNSLPNQSFTLEFFATAAAAVAGGGEGQTFIGETSVVTDATCQSRFTVSVPGGFVGQSLTATATDAAGNTSEFSPAVAILETMPTCQGGGRAVIAGQITTAEADQGLAGVTVEFFREEDGCQEQTTTNATGEYQFPNLGNGTYLVIPHHPGCRFEPEGWQVGLFGGNAELLFVATCP